MIGATVSVENLISKFEDMSNRGTLLCGENVTRDDILSQIIGTIIKTSMEEYKLESQVK